MTNRIETTMAETISEELALGGDALSAARAILAVFKADDIAVVELPADDSKALEHFEFVHGGVRQYDPNGFGSYRWFSFDEIRTLAPALLAMLAAADAAESGR